MSEPNDKAKEDALKALHGLGGDSDETEAEGTQEPHEEHEVAEPDSPSPSASGFVGMLAKEGAGKDLDAGASQAGMPPAEGTKAAGPTSPIKATTDQIYMAREIQPTAGTASAAPPSPVAAPPKSAPRRAIKGPPGWYHAAVPVMFTLGGVLLLIGFWSIGALVYMAMKKPENALDVSYPFLRAVQDFDTDAVDYTQGSKIMAWLMLMCLPVSIALGLMGGMMQRQIRAFEARKAAQNA